MFLLTNHYETTLSLWILFIVAWALAIVIIFLCFILNLGAGYNEKVASYECGFTPFEDARNIFDIKFYLIAILYLIFDLEALFFFPWSVNLSYISTDGILIMIDFIIELFVGYFYVWVIGALSWD